MDGQFRIWPRGGGYYDQDYRDVLDFSIIENKIREKEMRKSKPASTPVKGNQNVSQVRVPFDLSKKNG